MNPSLIPRASGTEEVVIPCASDSDSGSVDLQLNNLEDSQKDTTNDDFAGEWKDIVLFCFFKCVGRKIFALFSVQGTEPKTSFMLDKPQPPSYSLDLSFKVQPTALAALEEHQVQVIETTW